jgi:hypothetical protein
VRNARGDVERDRDVVRGRARREPDGVVKEELVRPGLDQQRRQAAQVGEHRADQRIRRIGGAHVVLYPDREGVRAESRVGGGLGRHAVSAERQVRVRGEQDAGGRHREVLLARGDQQGRCQAGAGGLAGYGDLHRARASGAAEGAVGGQGVVERGRERVLGR